MTPTERMALTRSATPYDPPVDQIKAKYEKLIAERQPVEAKICDAEGTLVGYILNGTAIIGSWSYAADGYTFKQWVELNNVKVIYAN